MKTKIGQILLEQQPEVYNKLNNKPKKKERKSKKERLSFNSWDRMVRNNRGIDERKCR